MPTFTIRDILQRLHEGLGPVFLFYSGKMVGIGGAATSIFYISFLSFADFLLILCFSLLANFLFFIFLIWTCKGWTCKLFVSKSSTGTGSATRSGRKR